MPKSDRPKTPSQRDQVREAAAVLRAGTDPRPDLADAVEAFLATITDGEERFRKTPTVPLYISKATWARAKVKADLEGRTRSDVIEEGYRALLAGQFAPTQPERSGWGSGSANTKTTPAVRLRDPKLYDQVAQYVTAHAKVWGWEPSPAQVAVAWLEAYAPAEDTASE